MLFEIVRRRFGSFRAALALALASMATGVHAQPARDAGEVALVPEAPFDRWCVAPLCSAPDRHPSLVKLPAVRPSGATRGLLEERLERALADSLTSAARDAAGPTWNLATVDLVEAVATALVADGDGLAKQGGVGGALIRAGLTYQLDGVVPRDPACGGGERLGAIYEGLALTPVFAPLGFPARRGRVRAACAPTARTTARTVDAAILRALVPDAARADATAVVSAVAEVRARCAGGTSPRAVAATRVTQPTTVREIADALRALRATPVPAPPAPAAPPPADDDGGVAPPPPEAPAPPSPAEQACAKAADALAAIAPERLDPLVKQGLADAPLAGLAEALQAPPAPSMALVTRLGTGTTSAADLRTLAGAIAAPHSTPLVADALAALPDALASVDGSASVDPDAIRAYLGRRYGVDDTGKPALRSLLGLAPTPWVFELNGGVPSADFSQQKVVADVSAGYATKQIGVVGRGWVNTYNIDDSQTHNDYTHAGGALEGWWLSGASAKLRVELRLSGAFDYYDTTTYPRQDALANFYDYDSRMGRGTAFVGLRYAMPTDRVSAALLAGGGMQYEDPDTTRTTGAVTLGLASQQNVSAQAAARLLVRWHIVPKIVGLRLRGDATYFRITREELTASIGAGSVTTSSTVDQQQQIEVHGRLFLDADVISFGGFIPALFGGVDYIGIQGTSTTTSATVPLVGAGIVRESW